MTKKIRFQHDGDNCQCFECTLRIHAMNNAKKGLPINDGITDQEILVIGIDWMNWTLKEKVYYSEEASVLPTPLMIEHFSEYCKW